jgi:hypothetical protein
MGGTSHIGLGCPRKLGAGARPHWPS